MRVWFLQKSLTRIWLLSRVRVSISDPAIQTFHPFRTHHVYRASMRISCQIANKQKTKNYRLKTLKFGMIQKSATKMYPLKVYKKQAKNRSKTQNREKMMS